jgi:hypothetical protein
MMIHPRRTGQKRRLSHAFPGRRFEILFIVFCLIRPLPSPSVLSFVGGSYILIYTLHVLFCLNETPGSSQQ